MKEYMVEISAIVGAIYIVARVVVVLTPTPKDDAALKKVARWLRIIGMFSGLDLKKGITKYKP